MPENSFMQKKKKIPLIQGRVGKRRYESHFPSKPALSKGCLLLGWGMDVKKGLSQRSRSLKPA
jgi:hypothetical protein